MRGDNIVCRGFHSSKVRIAGTFLLVVLAAAKLLAQAPADQAWKMLKTGAASSSSETRIKAIRALEVVGKNATAEQMAISALKDSKPEVKVAAIMTLGSIGSNAAPVEIKKVVPSGDAEAVFAAAAALYKLNDPAAYEIYYAALTKERKSGEGLVESQMKMLRNPKALAKVGFESGIGFVPFGSLGYGAYKTITKDDESPVRAAAALKLATDKDPKSGAALAKAASDEKTMVRQAAIAAIAMRGDATLLKAVTPRLEDKDETVRFYAAACVIRLSK
jgi:HEAT repeat protein